MSQTRPAKGGIHPVVLKVDTTPVTGKVDIKVYTPLTVNIGKRCVEGTIPLWLQTEVIYSDADRTILDQLRKCTDNPNRKLTIPQGIDPLKTAVEDIISQLKVVQEYVNVSARLFIHQNLTFLNSKTTKNTNIFQGYFGGEKTAKRCHWATFD